MKREQMVFADGNEVLVARVAGEFTGIAAVEQRVSHAELPQSAGLGVKRCEQAMPEGTHRERARGHRAENDVGGTIVDMPLATGRVESLPQLELWDRMPTVDCSHSEHCEAVIIRFSRSIECTSMF